MESGAKAFYGSIYYFSATKLRVLREYLTENEVKGWIRKSKFFIEAPILFVSKKDESLRLYVDYRALNKVTVKNRYFLFLIDEMIDRLSGAIVYIKLDFRDIYYRIRIRRGDEWKTTFRTCYSHFEYLVMFFGFINTPAIFQIYINKALDGLLDVIYIIYMDDICIFSKIKEKYINYVR